MMPLQSYTITKFPITIAAPGRPDVVIPDENGLRDAALPYYVRLVINGIRIACVEPQEGGSHATLIEGD